MKVFRPKNGQSMVEFALILPLILLIVILFVDLARIVYIYSALYHAVREGARYAVVTQFDTNGDRQAEVRQTVIDYAVSVPLNLTDVEVVCEGGTMPNGPCKHLVTVSAQIVVAPMIPFTAQIMTSSGTFTIVAESSMQMTPFGSYQE